MNAKTIWVDSTRGECATTTDRGCLKIKHNENDPWTLLESTIEGFDFVAGSIYKLKVSLDKEPTDSDNISYRLIEQLEAVRDPKLRLHDIWSLRKIDGQEIELQTEVSRPLLEIFISGMTIGGNAGCNSMQAKIIQVDGKRISFDKIATTKMMCPDFKLEQSFLNHLGTVSQYKLGDLSLTLMDESGKSSLTFRKVD